MNLPRIKIAIVGAKPMIIAPIVKKISATIIVIFLPYLSANGPAINEPKADPSYASDTMVYTNISRFNNLRPLKVLLCQAKYP